MPTGPDPRGAFARALAYCRAQRLFAPGARVLVGTAAGASSLGALGFLALARRELGLAALAAAAVDEGGLDDSDAVADAGRLARLAGVDFYALSAAPTRERRAPTERDAGPLRAPRRVLAALREHARAHGFTQVALGHTRDDAVLRALAGFVSKEHAGTRPWSGRAAGGALVRPLLATRAAEALELARTAGLEPPPLAAPAPGGGGSRALAERLARTVLPRLRVEAPEADATLLARARRAVALERSLAHLAASEVRGALRADGALLLRVDAERPRLASEALAAAALAALGHEAAPSRAEAARATEQLARCLRGARAPGGAQPWLVAHGVLAQRRGDETLELRRATKGLVVLARAGRRG